MTLLPAIPANFEILPVDKLMSICDSVIRNVDQETDVEILDAWRGAMEAIDAYMARRGFALAPQTALRKLEVRIGELIGPAVPGSHHSTAVEGAGSLSKDQRHDFRKRNMSALAHVLPPACHPNADWQEVNPGATSHTHSVIVAACTICGSEWALTLIARQMRGPQPQPGTRRASADIDNAYQRAVDLVASGATIAAACRETGIRRETFTRRRNGLIKRGQR